MREELHPNFNTWKTLVSNSSVRPNSAGNAFPWPHSFLLFLQSFYCLRSDVHPITGPMRPLLRLQALRLGLCLIFILLLRAFLSRFFFLRSSCLFFKKRKRSKSTENTHKPCNPFSSSYALEQCSEFVEFNKWYRHLIIKASMQLTRQSTLHLCYRCDRMCIQLVSESLCH